MSFRCGKFLALISLLMAATPAGAQQINGVPGSPSATITIVVELASPHQRSPRPSALPTIACAYHTGKMLATTMAETEEFAKS